MSTKPIHGVCEAQHEGDLVIKPSEPVCNGYPHIGPVRLDNSPPLEASIQVVRDRIPPSWTLVMVQHESDAYQGAMVWWVYVEPSRYGVEADGHAAITEQRLHVEDPDLLMALDQLVGWLNDHPVTVATPLAKKPAPVS